MEPYGATNYLGTFYELGGYSRRDYFFVPNHASKKAS